MSDCDWATCHRPEFVTIDGYRHCRVHLRQHLREFPDTVLPGYAKPAPAPRFSDSLARAHEILAELQVPLEALANYDYGISDIRQWAMYRIRMETYLTLQQIGSLFHRDHSTVVHAVKRVSSRLRDSAAA